MARDPTVFASRERDELVVFTSRKNSEFFAFGGLDELNFCHDCFSIANLSSMPCRHDDDRVAFDVKHDTPIADPQACSSAPLEPLHIALPGLCEGLKLGIETPADIPSL